MKPQRDPVGALYDGAVRVVESLIEALLSGLSLAASAWHIVGDRNGCRRNDHRMLKMTDGPICGDCGRAWIWAKKRKTRRWPW